MKRQLVAVPANQIATMLGHDMEQRQHHKRHAMLIHALRQTKVRLVDYSGIGYLKEYLRSKNRPNAVFIWIPKTAGTSLWSILNAPLLKNLRQVRCRFPGRGIVTFGHMDYAGLVQQGYVSRVFDESAYKFTFVRNPYARAVSLYSYLKRNGNLATDQSFLNFCRRLIRGGCEPIGLYNVRGLSQCNPQARWIDDIEMSYIGKVESVDEDAEQILSKLGLDNIRVPQLNTTDHPDYRVVYCNESKQIIDEFFAEDFRRFGYSHDELLGSE